MKHHLAATHNIYTSHSSIFISIILKSSIIDLPPKQFLPCVSKTKNCYLMAPTSDLAIFL